MPMVSSEARHLTYSLLEAVGVFETAVDGSWTFVNQRLAGMVDAEPAKLLDRGWLSFVHPEDLPRTVAEYKQARDAHRAWRHRFRMLRPDGTMLWVLINANPLPANPQERGVAYVGTVDDVTLEHRAQELVEESARMLRTLEAMVSEVIIVHREGYIVAANERAAEVLAYPSADQLIGVDLRSFTMQDDIKRMESRLQDHRNGPDTVRWRARDGQVFELSVRSRDLSFENAPARMISLVPLDDPHLTAAQAARARLRYTALLGALPLAMLRMSLDSRPVPGRIDEVNAPMCELLGRAEQDIVGHSILEFTLPEDVADSVSALEGISRLSGPSGLAKA